MADDHRSRMHPLRTALAAQGVHLSALFFAIFENTLLPGTPPRRPRLMAPPGPSTGGGKLSRQNLALIPADEAEGTPIVVGWVDAPTHQAELRTWRVLAETSLRRFGRQLDIPVAAYRAFMEKAASFLQEQGLAVRILDELPEGRLEPQRSSKEDSWLMVLLILTATLAVGVLLGVLIMTFFR